MKKKELVALARKIATEYKTVYVMGGVGGCLHDKGKARAMKNKYNAAEDRASIINAADADTFGFDCVGLIKGILWGWCGDTNPAYNYGGASFGSGGVPDVGADKMITLCSDVSTDFSTIDIGEMVWMSGHCGIYVGDGLVVESTPKWSDGVQLSAVEELRGDYAKTRKWTKHGRLPWVDYSIQDGDTVRIVGVASGVGDGYIIKYLNGKVVLAERVENE